MANSNVGEEKKMRAVCPTGENILRKILEKCKYESAHGLQKPLELYQERVLYYTETEDLLNEILEEDNVNVQLDLYDRAIINNALKEKYSQLESFSYSEIYEMVKDRIKIPDINKFCRIMRQLGYKPMNTFNYGNIVLEDPKLTFERYRYLNRIAKFRDAGKAIYYIDERIIDLSKTYKKPWIQYKDIFKIDGYVFFHIVSVNGLERGLFCNQANEEDFSKWVSDIVLSFIKPSSIIVMDKSPLHGSTMSEPITKYHSKSDMLKWLQRNNIPCSPVMRKASLYDLIVRCPFKDNQYKLDLIFKSHGHEVLRLPENYHDLSITELLWEHIRASPVLTSSDTANIFYLKNKIHSEITSIGLSKWHQFEKTIKETENNLFVIDEAIEQALDLYEIDAKYTN